MRTRFHALPAALGILASFGALADKGVPGGGASPDGASHGRGGSRFLDGGGAGPASAFHQHTNLVKNGGLEFQARSTKSGNGVPNANSSGDAALLAQGAAAGASGGKLTVAENEAAVLFAPWKVTDKDGKPVAKAGQCGTK